jgi:hypothetical protein
MTRISRRQFARTVGAAAGAALMPRARGDEKAKPAPGPNPPSGAPAPAKLSSASQAEADARVQTIVARYGARLSPAEREDLARQSRDAQQQLDKLRAFAVDEEPAHIFRASRKRR